MGTVYHLKPIKNRENIVQKLFLPQRLAVFWVIRLRWVLYFCAINL